MTAPDTSTDDPYLWLEDVDGAPAMTWVRQCNAATEAALHQVPGHAARRQRARAVLDSRERIPRVRRLGPYLFDLWRDDAHPRGLWRRTRIESFRQAEPVWEPLLDLDALAVHEGENWVWAGSVPLGPDDGRTLIRLSRGGADAVVVREFDLEAKAFVDEGFMLPEAKTDVCWQDANTLLVGTDTGPGSLTDSGYPRTVRRWRRGQPFAQAELIFEGEAADVSVGVDVDRSPGYERTIASRSLDFYRNRQWLLGDDGQWTLLDKPEDANLAFWRDRVLLELRQPLEHQGKLHPAGALLLSPASDFLRGRPAWQAVFTPADGVSMAGWTVTREHLVLDLLDNVVGRLEVLSPSADGTWTRRPLPTPSPGSLGLSAWHDPLLGDDDPYAEHLLVTYEDFLSPRRLLLGTTDGSPFETLKAEPAFFDGSGQRVHQAFATSRDGTRVPYFVITPAGEPPPGGWPTLLKGYGGFEIAYLPWYPGTTGSLWLEGGGAMLVANLRGGGEYGPAWHQAGSRERKVNSFDDFIAVAEDAIARGLTSAPRLAIQGGSNGGLLVGAVMLMRPELFGAVVCQVPLLDMRRYHRLLAGASWMAEYGDPDDPAQWGWIAPYSPYQNLRADMALPPVLFTTSTRDDRVHPGHARKMAAKMMAQGHKVLYHENTEGGHGGAADHAQMAELLALENSFLWQQIRLPFQA